MRPGERGLAVLCVVTAIFLAVGVIQSQDRIDCHAITLGGTAAVFWCWAVLKTGMSGGTDLDLGMFSFALVVAAAAHSRRALHSSLQRRSSQLARAWSTLFLMSGGCCVVMLNYLHVLFSGTPDLRRSFTVYLMVGAAWWGFAGLWTATSLYSHVRTLQSTDGDFESETLVEATGAQRFRVLLAQ